MRELEFPVQKDVQSGRPWLCEWSDTCTRKVPCPRHLGKRNKRKGQRGQAEARKALGIPNPKFMSQRGHEENWRWLFRVEVKSGQQVKAMDTRFRAAQAQSDAAKAEGDSRPFLFYASPDGTTDGLICMRASVWITHIAPLLEEYGGVA